MLFSAVHAQTAKDDLIASILGKKYDTDLLILGENGEETRTITTLRVKVLIIKNNIKFINPKGSMFAIVINCDSIISNKDVKIYSESDLNIFANYGAGVLSIENNKGSRGIDAQVYLNEAQNYNTPASNGKNGSSGRDASCGTFGFKSAESGDDGGLGSSGQKGLKGNIGYKGDNGLPAGSVIFVCKSFHQDAEIYINAIGGNGGNGGIGQTGGLGQKGGDGGKGGNGGKKNTACGKGPKSGGDGGNGGSGGDGGDGGEGGDGGDGGDGGFVKIYSLRKEIAPTLYVINNLGGSPGNGGVGGIGGIGGIGGQGGKRGKGGNGDLIFNPAGGGSAGKEGSEGRPGNPGSLGHSGKLGKRGKIMVEENQQYLQVEDGEITQIIRGIVESENFAI